MLRRPIKDKFTALWPPQGFQVFKKRERWMIFLRRAQDLRGFPRTALLGECLGQEYAVSRVAGRKLQRLPKKDKGLPRVTGQGDPALQEQRLCVVRLGCEHAIQCNARWR